MWATGSVTGKGTYSPGQSRQLTDVTNIANIEVGSRVIGPGVGREVYVRAKNVAAKTLTLSQPLYGGAGTRNFTFERYRYVLDFSGVGKYDRFNINDVDFTLDDQARQRTITATVTDALGRTATVTGEYFAWFHLPPVPTCTLVEGGMRAEIDGVPGSGWSEFMWTTSYLEHLRTQTHSR